MKLEYKKKMYGKILECKHNEEKTSNRINGGYLWLRGALQKRVQIFYKAFSKLKFSNFIGYNISAKKSSVPIFKSNNYIRSNLTRIYKKKFTNFIKPVFKIFVGYFFHITFFNGSKIQSTFPSLKGLTE